MMIELRLTGFNRISRVIPLDLSSGCSVIQSGIVKKEVVGTASIVVGSVNVKNNY